MKIRKIKNIEDLTKEIEVRNKFSELVRLKCYECSNFDLGEVRRCDIVTCPLHKVRLGKKMKSLAR